ncbi:MAG: FAD-binding oxidoreductase [Solirubrobacteraceae bacterium]
MTATTTVNGRARRISRGVLDDLQAQVLGHARAGQRAVREVFNAMHPSDPAVTISCSGTADVIAGVNFAREHGLPLAVRGGGHSVAGLSAISGGVLIDLAPMRAVHVDPDRHRAVVGGGALWGDVDRETQVFGLVAPGGVVSDTGVAGLTLGGGYGWVRRRYGLSVDALVEAQVVCADGQARTASTTSHPDLFWALRGGGGNFGVVTSFTFALQPLGPTVGFSATMYPVEDAAAVLRGWRDCVIELPDEVTSEVIAITMPASPEMPEVVHDRAVLVVGGVYVGDAQEGLQVMAPLRELGTPLFDMSGPTPFTAVQSGFDPFFPRNTLRAYWKSTYLNELSDAAIDEIADRARERPAPVTLVNVLHLGGAIARVDPASTAFVERRAPFMVSVDGMWSDAADDQDNIAWVRAGWEALSRHGNGHVYLNFTGRDGDAPGAAADSALGRNLDRLARVKAEYDPENFFHINNNIRPA